ncbi:MAG TPA: hypothetical protein VH372_14630, partial [Actinospica sp.]|nr:hypothetical protein [Actinospica sp.]
MDEALAPPEDLIELKARWYALKAECDRIAAQEPAGDFLRGSYQARGFSEEQSARLEEARARLRELTIEVARHPWKGRQPDRNTAERTLNEAARLRADRAAGDARDASGGSSGGSGSGSGSGS